MIPFAALRGVFAAAVTPIRPGSAGAAPEDMPALLHFLARRGCHGALLFGTTGEGPSFSAHERNIVLQAAAEVRQDFPKFRLLAGTGAPSLEDSLHLTRSAFEHGMDGVVVLPPYYFKKVSEDGLFAWFSQVLQRAVPGDGAVLAYHIPAVSGVGLSLDLLARLKDAFPRQFVGLKDSSGDPELAQRLGQRFGSDLVVLNGNDRLFSHALENYASGCITAMANLVSPDLRRVWEGFQNGAPDTAAQQRLNAARQWMDTYPPAPPILKAALNRWHPLPRWEVRPPLLALAPELEIQALAAAESAGLLPVA